MEWKWRCKLFLPVWKPNENWGGVKNGLEICVGPTRKFALQMWSENRLKTGKKNLLPKLPLCFVSFSPPLCLSLSPPSLIHQKASISFQMWGEGLPWSPFFFCFHFIYKFYIILLNNLYTYYLIIFMNLYEIYIYIYIMFQKLCNIFLY